MFDGGAYGGPGQFAGFDEVRRSHCGFSLLADPSAPKKIDAVIVRDAKQPRRERARVVEGVETAIGSKHSVLNHIFAIGY
jgi:hypothetical protein